MRVYLLGNIYKLIIYSNSTISSATSIHNLIWRVSDYCFYFHVFSYEIMNFFDKKFGLIFDFVDKVIGRPHIGLAFAEAKECAARD